MTIRPPERDDFCEEGVGQRCMAVNGEEDKDGDDDDFLAHDEDAKKDADEAKEDENITDESNEAFDARLRPNPSLPSRAEVEKHEVTHYPYRSWCRTCVAAKAREMPHFRKKNGGRDDETGLPVVAMDYEMLEEKITTLVIKDESSGAVLCYECECKGPRDSWVVRQLCRDLEEWGRSDICLKTDGEPAMVALQAAVAGERPAQTVPRNPPAYNPQTNGSVEKAVQDVTAHIRVLILALEERLKTKIDLTLPVVRWVIRHAAFLHTRFSVGHDGMTPWRRLTGRNWTGSLVEFGERVLGKLALKKSSTDKKSKRGKKKLAARSVDGIYVGVYPRTGEHLICKADGEVIRVRTVHRVVVEDRWRADLVLNVKATPRQPNPNNEKTADISGKLNVDEEAKADGAADGAVPQDEREVAADHSGPRELRINERLLEKYGYTVGCPGCIHKQLGLAGHRAHNDICRRRIYAAMAEDVDELDRLTKNQEKLSKKPPEQERIARPTAPDAEGEPNRDLPRKLSGDERGDLRGRHPTHGGGAREPGNTPIRPPRPWGG